MKLNIPYADELTHTGPLTKPSKVARLEKKAEVKAAESKARAKSEKADRARLAAIREACYERDKGLCRACWRVVQLHGHPLERAECHHMEYRSQQGSDELSNRITLCVRCHEAEHLGKLEITGDPNGELRFRDMNPESGRVKRTWISECPR